MPRLFRIHPRSQRCIAINEIADDQNANAVGKVGDGEDESTAKGIEPDYLIHEDQHVAAVQHQHHVTRHVA